MIGEQINKKLISNLLTDLEKKLQKRPFCSKKKSHEQSIYPENWERWVLIKFCLKLLVE